MRREVEDFENSLPDELMENYNNVVYGDLFVRYNFFYVAGKAIAEATRAHFIKNDIDLSYGIEHVENSTRGEIYKAINTSNLVVVDDDYQGVELKGNEFKRIIKYAKSVAASIINYGKHNSTVDVETSIWRSVSSTLSFDLKFFENHVKGAEVS